MICRVGCWSLVGLLMAAPPVLAATRTYPSSPPCSTTLQACLDGAGDGDRIEIVTTAPIGESLMISRSVTITGASGVTPVLGGTPAGANLLIGGNAGGPSTVTLEGLTISNGSVRVNPYLSPGGDVVTIDRCSISNTAFTGILVDPDFPIEVRIVNNLLATGGNVIDINAIAASGKQTVTIAGNRITASTPGYNGIVLDLRGTSQPTVNVFSNVVYGVTERAVSIYTVGSPQATVNIVNNTFDKNAGGGLQVLSVSPTSTLGVNLLNNILSRSTGPAAALPASAQLTVSGGFNAVFGNGAPDVLGGFSLGTPLYNVDPLFTDADGADYRLKNGSVLINGGTNVPPGGLPETDADGNLRVANGVVDVGAYEFGSMPPTTTTTTVTTSTTTTLPCVPEATIASVGCRLAGLAADVAAQVPAGKLQGKLLGQLATASAALQEAEGATSEGARKRALRRVVKALGGSRARLNTRAAKAIDASLRQALADRLVALKRDAKALVNS